MTSALAELEDVHVIYRGLTAQQTQHALRGVTLRVAPGEIVGVVGESGCGKSTMARVLLRLVEPESGVVRFAGSDLAACAPRQLRRLRRRMQLVFQDPVDALNPRWTVRQCLADALRLTDLPRTVWDERIDDGLAAVGLEPAVIRTRRPHELSGGQAQRVGICRALLVDPDLIVFDEPTSALDVTVQAQILDLVRSLVTERARTYIYISHDLATVRFLATRVIVLYLGRVVEQGTVEQVFTRPLHPYTRALLSSAPSLRGHRLPHPVELESDPDRRDVEAGCPLTPRCPFARPRCAEEDQALTDYGEGHLAACWRVPEISDVPSSGITG